MQIPGKARSSSYRRDSDGLDVGDGGGAAEDADVGREGRLEARLALLALQRLDQRRLLAADVGAGAAVDEHVKVVARTAGVLADQTLFVRLVDGDLENKNHPNIRQT